MVFIAWCTCAHLKWKVFAHERKASLSHAHKKAGKSVLNLKVFFLFKVRSRSSSGRFFEQLSSTHWEVMKKTTTKQQFDETSVTVLNFKESFLHVPMMLQNRVSKSHKQTLFSRICRTTERHAKQITVDYMRSDMFWRRTAMPILYLPINVEGLTTLGWECHGRSRWIY